MLKKLIYILLFLNLLLLNISAQSRRTFDPQINTFLPSNVTHVDFVNTPAQPELFNWQMIQTPVTHYITDIFFYDSLYGWAVDGNGGFLKTINSGFAWSHTQIVNPGIGELMGVYFLNRDTGWIMGISAYIRKTTNNGASWIVQDYPPFGSLPLYNSVKFINYNTGYITGGGNGNSGYIIKTTNSGQNWQQIYLDTAINTPILGQCWVNDSTAFMMGLNILLKTSNKGSSFTNYYNNLPPTTNGANGLLGIYFINGQTGWLSAGNKDEKNLYKTTNEGLNWVFQDNPVAQFQFSQLNDVIFINENTGWASSYAGLIITTTNGGSNWITDYISSETNAFSKYSSSKIWLGGASGEVWYLDNTNPIGIQPVSNEIPNEFSLKQNYPNPFNPVTNIKYDIPSSSNVTIRIYDLLGREIFSVNEFKTAGSYEIKFDGSNYASGMYFYSFEANGYKETKKMVLIK